MKNTKKRAISVICSAALLVSAAALPLQAAAAETSGTVAVSETATAIEGILKPGYTLTVSPTASGTYQWYRGASENGEWTPIDGATSESYTLVNADGRNYIKFAVLDNGIEVESSVTNAAVDAPLGQFKLSDANSQLSGKLTSTSKPEYHLAIPGTDIEFTVLDESNDKKSSFFLYSHNFVINNQPADPYEPASGRTFNFDPNKVHPSAADKREHIKYKLLDVYLNAINGVTWKNTSGTTYQRPLPDAYKPYVDTEHVWLTEGSKAIRVGENDYTFKAGVTLLSYNELFTYADRLRIGDGNPILLRTGNNDIIGQVLALTNSTSTPIEGKSVGNIHPCFWIGEDFFKNVKIDINKTGSVVKQMICDRYTMDELAGLYTTDELAAIGYDVASFDVSDVAQVNEKFEGTDGSRAAAYKFTVTPVNNAAITSVSVTLNEESKSLDGLNIQGTCIFGIVVGLTGDNEAPKGEDFTVRIN